MIKTTYPVYYGGTSSNNACQPNCGSGLGGGVCIFFNNFLCAITTGGKSIQDLAISYDSIMKMLPMFAVLLILGMAIGLAKGKSMIPIPMRMR